jgi:hypothetical protein
MSGASSNYEHGRAGSFLNWFSTYCAQENNAIFYKSAHNHRELAVKVFLYAP